MAITWKKNKNFKPQILFDSIKKIRSVSTEGVTSFSGFEINDSLPALQSMLDFPSAADDLDKSSLVRKAISIASETFTADSFLHAINNALLVQTGTSLQPYKVLTSMSLAVDGGPRKWKTGDMAWQLLVADFPKKYVERNSAIAEANIPVEPTPSAYAKVIVTVKAKSSYQAMTKALRMIDIQRGVWCLIANARWEFHGTEWMPINKVRLGGAHTVHLANGTATPNSVWFEPNYVAAPPFRPENQVVFRKTTANILRRMFASQYSERLCNALLRFVRALDERDQNHALVKLWGALEELACPDSANYEKLVQRCSYCFKDTQYHRQMLEHLREYRNQTVHAANVAMSAKVHCFQLQQYFYELFLFHIRNIKVFANLEEANQFLDLPGDMDVLLRRKRMIEKAIRFTS
jgi:hypothetical protein